MTTIEHVLKSYHDGGLTVHEAATLLKTLEGQQAKVPSKRGPRPLNGVAMTPYERKKRYMEKNPEHYLAKNREYVARHRSKSKPSK